MYSQSVSALISKNVGNTLTNYKTWGSILYNVKEYGAKGDGITDDTAAIQTTFDEANTTNGIVIFPIGTYYITATIQCNSGVKGVIGYGSVLLSFQNTLDSIGISINSCADLVYYNIRHTQKSTITNPAIWIQGSSRVTVSHCTVETSGGHGIGLALDDRITIEQCYFTDTGKTSLGTGHPSHPAIWVGQSPTYTNNNIRIINNHFYNTNWSGIYFFAIGGLIQGNLFDGCRESTIFGDGCANTRIIGNRIVGGSMVNVAGFGIEAGGTYGLVIQGNDISYCDEAAIGIANPTNFVISGNYLHHNGKGGGAQEQKSGICFRYTSNSTPNAPSQGSVTGNIITDEIAGGQTQKYGISTIRLSGTGGMSGVIITGNYLAGNLTSPVYWTDANTINYDTVLFSNNYGYAQKPKTLSFTTAAATGIQSFNGFGFKPRFIHIEAFVDSTVQTCSIDIDTYGSGTTTGKYSYGGTTTKSIGFLQLTDSAGNIKTTAAFSSINNDGFSLNFSNAVLAVNLIVTCYP